MTLLLLLFYYHYWRVISRWRAWQYHIPAREGLLARTRPRRPLFAARILSFAASRHANMSFLAYCSRPRHYFGADEYLIPLLAARYGRARTGRHRFKRLFRART